MIGGIIAAICLGLLMVATVFASAFCAAGDGIMQAFCNSEHDTRTGASGCNREVDGHNCATGDDVTCCFGCTTTGDCTGKGCEWVAEYSKISCNCNCEEKDQVNCNDQTDGSHANCVCPSVFADESTCDAAQTGANAAYFGGTGWTCTTTTIKATCDRGTAGETFDKDKPNCAAIAAPGTGTASDGKVTCNTMKSQDVSGKTWANTGCPNKGVVATDGDEDGADGSHYCEYSGIANMLVFLHLGVVIAVSVGGCCVVCCGKGPDDGDDDDGKSDE
jgi:hypothetical protein